MYGPCVAKVLCELERAKGPRMGAGGQQLLADECRGPASAGLRVPKGWTAQAKNEGSDTKFDAGESPALVGLTEL